MSHLESGVAKKLLLMRKIDMSTCLHASAMNGHVLVTRHLLKIGGNELLYMRKNSGASCLYDSAEAGQDETVENSVQSSFRVRQNGGVPGPPNRNPRPRHRRCPGPNLASPGRGLLADQDRDD